jgi:predicted metallopeptidase
MDIAIRCADFRHLHVPRILMSVTQARDMTLHGLQARVTPLRFHGGAVTKPRRGVPYQIQRFYRGDHEYLYVMTFVLPRYLDQDFDQKFVTLFHELQHIGPAFDGDLRRHEGRYAYHSHCQREYNIQVAHIAREYLQTKPDPSLFSFLRMTFAQLQARHGSVRGVVVPRPKIIPLIAPYVTV